MDALWEVGGAVLAHRWGVGVYAISSQALFDIAGVWKGEFFVGWLGGQAGLS